jgi:hypothetical protein
MADRENFLIDLDLTQNQTLTVEGILDIADWWIDPDFFARVSDNEFTFVPIAGKYRITANTAFKYFKVEVMSGNSLAVLQDDGTGAIWVIGNDKIGKPSYSNGKEWEPEYGLCCAPVGNKKYQITLVAGVNMLADAINFKFFHQKDWGKEFGYDAISTASDLVVIKGPDVDSGNLALAPDKTFETDAVYVFVVDVSAGNDQAVLTVTKK